MTEVILHQKTQKRLLPKLRFKEFDGEWIEKRLGEMSTGISYGIGAAATEFDGINKYLRITDIDEESREFKPNPLTSPEGESVDKYRLKEGDIVFARTGASVGKSYLYNKLDGILIYAGFLIKFHISKADPRFIYALTFKESYNKWVHVYSMRSGQPGLNAEEYKELKLNIPSLSEQQKIASFLSAVDNKIQQLTKKKELLEQYKKGVMQKLFSQEIRFKDKDGKGFPEWEENSFRDLYSFIPTNSLSRDKLNYESGFVYNIHYGDIHTKFKTAFVLKDEKVPFVNDEVNLSKIKSDSFCKNGDLVIADASEDYVDIGKTIELIDLEDEQVLAGLHTFLARPKTSKTTIGFFSILLQSWSMRKQIMVIAQGTKVLSLSTCRVGKLKLKLPVIQEQQKIAAFLSSIDTKIDGVNQQITQTQLFKKGLLQQMFV
ncbi:restriction endonuclease subunit S [Aureitalea sp. L0-47]|uniref:restriction endonuclease subunit S n=1 Tax=Aureitalea sp. L0-47 TaxID=2816962 RepID=UPI002238FA48|nr:restriction endonuclease subunit S [Aureitalea sp. L0-47]MCW5521116.1 restriction endonuclease subunit S [Aureitalea sp. L0-47]